MKKKMHETPLKIHYHLQSLPANKNKWSYLGSDATPLIPVYLLMWLGFPGYVSKETGVSGW